VKKIAPLATRPSLIPTRNTAGNALKTVQHVWYQNAQLDLATADSLIKMVTAEQSALQDSKND